MYLSTLSLRLDFLHYEEACIQKSFNAVSQAGLFTPREPCRGCTSDASAARGGKKSARVISGRTNLSKGGARKRGENVTHLSQHILVKVWIDCWTRACACSRSRNDWSSFCSVKKSVSIRNSNEQDRASDLGGVIEVVGHGRTLARG